MRLRLTLMGLALVSSAALAADAELTELRQQVLQMKRDYEQRIRALEARVSRAEAAAEQAQTTRRNAATEQAATTAQTPLDKALADASAAAPGQVPSPTTTPGPFSGASSGPFRFIEMSFDILGVGGWSTAPDSLIEELQGGGHDPKRRGFTLQQGELGLAAAVDPYFNAQAYIVFTDELVELEEAYLTTTSLPWDLQVKAGHFFTEFGRNNPLHPHAWAWIDQPLINTRSFGGDGSRAPGVRLSWLLPTPWYSEVYLGAQNGNHETLVSFLGAREDAEGGIGGLSAIVDAQGKQRKHYPYERMMTPYEKLKSLPNPERFLKPGVTFEQLNALALQMSDNEAAAKLRKARQQLFQRIHEQPPQSSGSRPPQLTPEANSLLP